MSKKLKFYKNLFLKGDSAMKKWSFSFLCAAFGLIFCAINVSAQADKTVKGGVLNGKAINLTKPDYPPSARAVGAIGAVNVEVLIDEKGNVISTSIISGHPLLRRAAEAAAKTSKFSPTLLNGTPVKISGILVYNFDTKGNQIGIKTQTEEIEEEALNGLATKLPSPEYPPAARAVGASGKVRIKVTLDDKGNVVSATALSGHPLLREVAVTAAKEAKFDPKNKAFKSEGILIYVFFALPKESGN